MADELIERVLHEAGLTDEEIRAQEAKAQREAEQAAKTEPTEDANLMRHTRLH